MAIVIQPRLRQGERYTVRTRSLENTLEGLPAVSYFFTAGSPDPHAEYQDSLESLNASVFVPCPLF